MVERFNGRISEIIKQTRFITSKELKKAIFNYLHLYNHHIPQASLEYKTPVEALKNWQKIHPQTFIKSVYNHTKRNKKVLLNISTKMEKEKQYSKSCLTLYKIYKIFVLILGEQYTLIFRKTNLVDTSFKGKLTRKMISLFTKLIKNKFPLEMDAS